MIADIHGRLWGSLEPPPQKPKTRTPAQQEAARRNGAKTRGPVTPEGKARSRMNALKHGLLAKTIIPPADARGFDRLYMRIRRELVEQFKPADFVAHAAIDALAHDYVRLARVCRMEELLQQPNHLSAEQMSKWELIQKQKRIAADAKKAVAYLGSASAPACEVAEAERIAAMVGDYLTNLQANWDSYQDDLREAAADADMDCPAEPPFGRQPTPADLAFEAEEDRNLCELVKLLMPAKERLADSAYVVAILTGQRRPTRLDRERLTAVLQDIVKSLRGPLADGRDFEAQLQAVCDTALLRMAQSPNGLVLLSQYRSRIERSIARQLRLLRRE